MVGGKAGHYDAATPVDSHNSEGDMIARAVIVRSWNNDSAAILFVPRPATTAGVES